MSVSVQVTGILGRRMEVAVPAERVEKAFSLRLQTVSRTAKIKGFRPGKAPLDIVRRQHGGQVRDEVVNELIGQALGESLRQEGLQPVGQPQVEPLSLGSGEDLRFAAHFEVYPTVTLQGHEGMELSLPQVEVTAADIDAMIETLRKQRPDYVDAGRAAQDQDRVTVDFEGTLDGVPFDGGKAEGINFILGGGRMIPDFEAGIRGGAAGETRTFDVNFPADYGAPQLAGKTAQFTATVQKVEEPKLPELNDEFCKAFGIDEGGIERLRGEVADNMNRELAQTLKQRRRSAILDKLAESNPLELPQLLVEQAIRELQLDMLRRMGARDAKALPPRDPFVEPARKRVQIGLLMTELVNRAGIQIEASVLEERIAEAAAQTQNPEEAEKQYRSNPQVMQQLQMAVLEEAALEWVASRANVTPQPATFREVMNFGAEA